MQKTTVILHEEYCVQFYESLPRANKDHIFDVNPYQAYLPRGFFCLIMSHGRAHSAPPCVNPDRKMLLTWNLAQSYFAVLQKKWQKKIFKIAAIGMMTSLICQFFWKIMRKMAKIGFFSKINQVKARKKSFKIFFQLLRVKIRYKLNVYRLIG